MTIVCADEVFRFSHIYRIIQQTYITNYSLTHNLELNRKKFP